MVTNSRLLALATTTLLTASLFLGLFVPAVSATAGRDSPAAAVDGALGPFLGWPSGPTYVTQGPPVQEDWYKFNVTAGQMFQASMFIQGQGRITVYHQTDTTNAITFESAQTPATGPVQLGVYEVRAAFLDLYILKTELIYLKISSTGMGGVSTRGYDLYMRVYDPPTLGTGTTTPSVANADAIHGWAFASTFGFRYSTDYYWVNASDGLGANHQRYRVQLTQTCATAMYDLYLYQFVDTASQRLELLNHSLAMERRSDRYAATTQPEQVDFAPVLYDGKYLVQVSAIENGSFAILSMDRFTYSLSVTTSGGLAKDGNDRRDTATWVNASQKVNNRIDGRDDNADWYQFPLLAGDKVSAAVTLLNRPEVVTWALRFNVIVFAPNGTVVRDEVNYHFQGFNLIYEISISIQEFTAAVDGNYSILIFAADGALDTTLGRTSSGGQGASWADYELNLFLPNRKPVQRDIVPDYSIDEDTYADVNLNPYFFDPEGKPGFPNCLLNGTYSDFTFSGSACNFRVTPKADYNGRQRFNITVRDEVTTRWLDSWFNVSVEPINDAPRLQPLAHANYDIVTLAEDAETTVPLRSIFWDIDDAALDFSAGGVSGSHVSVFINNVSQIATITPDPNWNGEAIITWTASDAGLLSNQFEMTIVVSGINDAPRATDRRLDRIVFNEGNEFTVDLSGEFFDLDGDGLEYYGYIEDPNVAQHVRINNSNLLLSEPLMRIYVLDRDRADYYSDGPVQIKFGVRDPSNNYDPATGQNLTVEKTTFLEILNVNDPPLVDDFSPTPSEVATNDYHEGDSITFSVTSVKDPDREVQFFYKWIVNGEEVPQETTATYVFKTVLDSTRPGQYAEGTYAVSVQVFDATGAKATREPSWNVVVLKANRVPTVQILRPTVPTFEEGQFIDFQALATDEDPEDVGGLTINWTYLDASGHTQTLGTGERIRTTLDPGTYTITVHASDGVAESTRPITVTVVPHSFNTPGFDFSSGLVALGAAAAAMSGLLGRRAKRA